MERVVTAAYRAAVVLLLAFLAYQQYEAKQDIEDAAWNAQSRAFHASAPEVQKVQVINSDPIAVNANISVQPTKTSLGGYWAQPIPVRVEP
jgi:hypothetical protein